MNDRVEQAALSRQLFAEMLTKSLFLQEFYSQVGAILDTDPYFMPGHLEMLWRADERRDAYLKKKLHRHLVTIIRPVLYSRSLQQALSAAWKMEEQEALKEVMAILTESTALSTTEQWQMRAGRTLIDQLITPQVMVPEPEPKYMVLTKEVDPKPLQDELKHIAPYWWQINTARQEEIIHHQHTWSLLLRKRTAPGNAFAKMEEDHESEATEIASWFPVIHGQVLELAREMDLGLGRVVIVMMKPWSQSYRHFDFEPFLVGRDRYHMVVSCGNENILSSGVDTVVAKPGDVWLFDNKAMHRADNRSALPRYHVIFDGYPLDRK